MKLSSFGIDWNHNFSTLGKYLCSDTDSQLSWNIRKKYHRNLLQTFNCCEEIPSLVFVWCYTGKTQYQASVFNTLIYDFFFSCGGINDPFKASSVKTLIHTQYRLEDTQVYVIFISTALPQPERNSWRYSKFMEKKKKKKKKKRVKSL